MTSETGYVRRTDAVFWRQEIGTEIQSNNLGGVGQIATRAALVAVLHDFTMLCISVRSNIWLRVPLRKARYEQLRVNMYIFGVRRLVRYLWSTRTLALYMKICV